jgi:hypothetical protein
MLYVLLFRKYRIPLSQYLHKWIITFFLNSYFTKETKLDFLFNKDYYFKNQDDIMIHLIINFLFLSKFNT